MRTILSFLVLLALVLPAQALIPSDLVDPSRLRELLQDNHRPVSQSQAALLLVESPDLEAENIVRLCLQQTESSEVFTALTAAIRLCRDSRFNDELISALSGGRATVRHDAAEALAVLTTSRIILKLQALADNPNAEMAVRQEAIWTLGHSGQKAAALILLDQLSNSQEPLRRAAEDALVDLTGQNFGHDLPHWRAWWNNHKDLTDRRWLEERLVYQSSRSRRLEAELERTRIMVVRLEQQLYSRLPIADRLGYVQTLADLEDPTVRGLAVNWILELLAGADAVGKRSLEDALLKLSGDASLEVQRSAVIGLGRVSDPKATDRLLILLRRGRPPVRAAAARSLTQQASGTEPGARHIQSRIVPALQKALDDQALEVVVEAAEDLGTLGLQEAGPVLTSLLKHPSESVRQTAAQALERVADPTVVEGLVSTLDDPVIAVRFSLVGALGHAAADAKGLSDVQKSKVIARLENLLGHDTDPGVRSRAATVLGEFGSPAVLSGLWKRVRATEDNRVQDKAWTAITNIIIRAHNGELLKEWDRTLVEAKEPARRLQLLAAVCDTWKKGENKDFAHLSLELLIQVQLEQGKWAAAFPCIREVMSDSGSELDQEKRLHWLLTAGEQALKEGNNPECLHIVREAQPFLTRNPKLAAEFEKLEHQAQPAASKIAAGDGEKNSVDVKK